MNKPLMIFDGDCTFCRHWIERWKRRTGDRVDFAPYQTAAQKFPEIPLARFQAAVQLILPSKQIYDGAAAVFHALALSPRGSVPLWLYEHLPGFAPLSETFYRLVAGHRPFFSRLTVWLWGREYSAPRFLLARRIFTVLLAVVYAIAFFSLGSQVKGLIGADGILPATSFLSQVHEKAGATGYFYIPSLFWITAADRALVFGCWAGVLSSILLAVGFAPPLFLAINWMLYLSFASVGGDFLRFQWDALLLETGFLAIFLWPFPFKPGWGKSDPPSRLVLFLFRWLLFRLMFLSAAVKWLSGDSAWRNLTAITYHYETQPLPTWIGWYAHQLPMWFQRFSTGAMFFIEAAVPFLIFAPRRLRSAGALVLISFQLLIAVTGNYCFFNLLTMALCLLLLDDAAWPEFLRRRLDRNERSSKTLFRWPSAVCVAVSVILLLASVPIFLGRVTGIRWADPVYFVGDLQSPFMLANNYGLFAVMTKTRPEITVEGSNDGQHWLAYSFKYKAGDLKTRPGFVAPHQPRLDWQMWFAALGSYEQSPWFMNFMVQLLRGSPPVLALLDRNPFPYAPPKMIRAEVQDYRFTDWNSRRASGRWWQSSEPRLYCPPMSLRKES